MEGELTLLADKRATRAGDGSVGSCSHSAGRFDGRRSASTLMQPLPARAVL
jgi:hypothetical protein